MKEIKIEVPEGYEIDKENSTFEKIVFKEKEGLPMSWEDLGVVEGFYIANHSSVRPVNVSTIKENKNVWPTRELAEAAIALSQLLQLRDRWNGDWKPDWTDNEEKYVIRTFADKVEIEWSYRFNKLLAFKTPDLRNKFLETFRDLIETAKPLL